jgi:hypothetical protein
MTILAFIERYLISPDFTATVERRKPPAKASARLKLYMAILFIILGCRD